MTDDSLQAETERQNMLRRTEQLTRLREEFSVPYTPEDLPTLTEAAGQLSNLAGIVQDLSAQIRIHSGNNHPSPELDAALEAYGKAAGHLSAAAGHYGSTCSKLPFLQRYPQDTKDPVLSNARGDAFVLAQKGVSDTRDRLSARASMANGASALEEPPSVTRAARARSSRADHARGQTPAPADAETQAASPAQQQPPHAPGNTRAR